MICSSSASACWPPIRCRRGRPGGRQRRADRRQRAHRGPGRVRGRRRRQRAAQRRPPVAHRVRENAERQAIAAARAALGVAFDPDSAGPPWFWSDQFDANVQLLGLPDASQRVIERRVSGRREQRTFFFCQARGCAPSPRSTPGAMSSSRASGSSRTGIRCWKRRRPGAGPRQAAHQPASSDWLNQPPAGGAQFVAKRGGTG